MQESRREFIKKGAVVVGAGMAAGAATLVASNDGKADSNGVIVGKSPKKEILYKKSKAWDDYYTQVK